MKKNVQPPLTAQLNNGIADIFETYKQLVKHGGISQSGQFVPAIHYPPITRYPKATEDSFYKDISFNSEDLFDLYAHIPFCKSLCAFCHYPVKANPKEEEMDYYLSMLEKEMDLYLKKFNLDKFKARTILIGGGTPTYLTTKQFERFLTQFLQRVDATNCTQFNIDLDPNTLLGKVGKEKISLMQDFGIDRLTIGVQSFDNEVLKIMGRHHDSSMAVESIQVALENNFIVNTEYIFGYPKQSMDSWLETVKMAISLDPHEIQLYRLKIEPYGDRVGPVGNLYKTNPNLFPSIETIFEMKKTAHEYLNSNGYNETLVRVFSKDSNIYSHYAESMCCTLTNLLGFGQTAFSSFNDRFCINTDSFEEYYKMLNMGQIPIDRGLIRSQDEQIRWAFALPLRASKISKRAFFQQAGIKADRIFRSKVELLKEIGLLEEDETYIGLTKNGRFFADEISQIFFHPSYIPISHEGFEKGGLNPFLNWLTTNE